ncbi:hypothetical protein [Paenibacillus sp. LHD-38]|uniref:hypothetical protein n=1 Tax=Paenibacillus sp. LHD-38 TaxID=3072143 RepID=UPI00280F267E|nr:hypothetical protein [Paenibacillus sp. LHD-38]MDQ8738322.1 hypothetical protein [Paenibacillus sp. LHD-38]
MYFLQRSSLSRLLCQVSVAESAVELVGVALYGVGDSIGDGVKVDIDVDISVDDGVLEWKLVLM